MIELVVGVYREFSRDGGGRLAAALAYYALFAFTPALLLSVALAAAVVGQSSVNALLHDSLARLLGPTLAASLIDLATSRSAAYHYEQAWIAFAVLFVSSVLALNQMQIAFDRMWSVTVRDGVPLRRVVLARLAQTAIALLPAALLLAGVLANSLAALLASRPGLERFGQLPEVLGSPLALLGSSALAFVLMFKYLPDVIVPWRSVLVSAVPTAAAWVIGTYVFGLYVGRSSMVSLYGAAGSAIVLLIWLNYSARVMLLGCKVCKVWTERRLGTVRVRPYAARVAYRVLEEAPASASE